MKTYHEGEKLDPAHPLPPNIKPWVSSLTPVSPVMHLEHELESLRKFTSSADMCLSQIDFLEAVLIRAKANSGIKSPMANNLVIGLLQQLRWAVGSMFLADMNDPDGQLLPIPDGMGAKAHSL